MPDLYDKLIDAVIGECDTTNLDRGAARMQIMAVLGATPERLAALKRLGDQFHRAGNRSIKFIDSADVDDVLTLAGYHYGRPINAAEPPHQGSGGRAGPPNQVTVTYREAEGDTWFAGARDLPAINPAEALRSIAQQIGKDTGREVDEEAFDRLAALLGAGVVP